MPLMVGLAIVALFLFLLAQRLQSWRLLVAAITVLALIGGVFVTGNVVVTPRRQLIERTKDWVAWTAPMDVNKVCGFCNHYATVVGSDGELWFDINGLANKLADLSRSRLIQEQEVADVQAAVSPDDPKQGRSLLRLRTVIGEVPDSTLRVSSTWLISWTRLADDQWYATEIKCLKVNDQPARDLSMLGLPGGR